MTYYYCAGVAPVQFLKQSSHGCLLSLCSRVVGLTSDIEPSLVADAYRVGVVVLAVRSDHPLRSSWLNRSVTTDYVVVADTELPALAAMPRVDLSSRACLGRHYCRTMDYQHRYAAHNSSLFILHSSLLLDAAYCSQSCHYRCCDARNNLRNPLQCLLSLHYLPPSFLRLSITFIIYPLSFIISKGSSVARLKATATNVASVLGKHLCR